MQLGKPVYVLKLDVETNEVWVGEKEELKTYEVYLEKLNFFLPTDLLKGKNLWGQVRYRTPPKAIEKIEEYENRLYMKFKEPFEGVAKGQIGAIYLNNEILVGGGVIV